MKESFKLVDGKIVAYDNNAGIMEYEYQDNIEEVLNQENVVEQLSNDIEELKIEENNIEKHKNSFRHLFFSEGFGDHVICCVMASALIMYIDMVFQFGVTPGMEVIDIICRAVSGVTLLSSVPLGIHKYKKTKLGMKAKSENIKIQIKEFEEILEKELEKLITLKQTKTKSIPESKIGKDSKDIDNSKIEVISDITKKKQLYKFFREYILKIEKFNDKDILSAEYDATFSDEDVAYIEDMASKNSVLAKTKSRKK